MLLPRCTHRRLWCTPPREFHTTRPYLRDAPDIFQMDPHTAEAVIGSSPWLSKSRPMDNGRTSMKLRAGKQNVQKEELFSTKLSLHLRPRDRSARASEGDGGIGSRVSRNQAVLNESLSLQKTSARRKTRPDASRNAAQSVSNKCGGITSPTLSPSVSPLLADGRIQPRVNGDPFLKDLLPPSPQSPIATLAHGLDRVLFNPGVQWLQNPQSQVYGFTTWLQEIIPVRNFAFERLQSFVPSSRDEDLFTVAQREGRKYAGSTSSLTGLLGQLYYLISGDKPINATNLSDCFKSAPQTFTPGQRGAASVLLNYRNGVYLIDSAGDAVPGLSNKNILTWMGTLLEKFLTHPPQEFLNLTRSVHNPAGVTKKPRREAYRYAKSDKFVLRSQLDCFDSRLPGTGVFDIKTRAVVSIRHDLLNFEESSGYQIHTLKGIDKSFEKEYYDLIRSAFLKYSFQARIGNMDGVFVAYHNTERIFGFQYIPLSEMDARLFGESAVGDAVFEKCMLLLEEVLEKATHEFPCQSIRLTAEKRKSDSNLRVFLEPAEWDEEHRGSRPVIQLDVSAQNYINESVTDGWSAVKRSNLPWTVSWSISKSTLNTNIIRENLDGARKRSLHKLSLPKGVEWQEMENFWHKLQFNPTAPVDVPFKAELFRRPSKNIYHLRTLAQEGRRHLKRSIRKQKGKPKRVLGIPNDAKMVAPLVALAHRPIADASQRTATKLSQKFRKPMRLEAQRRKGEFRMGIPDDAKMVAPPVALAHGPFADASQRTATEFSQKIRNQLRLEDQTRKMEASKARAARRTKLAPPVALTHGPIADASQGTATKLSRKIRRLEDQRRKREAREARDATRTKLAPPVAPTHGPIADASQGTATKLSRKIRKQMRLDAQRMKREVRKAKAARRAKLAQSCAS